MLGTIVSLPDLEVREQYPDEKKLQSQPKDTPS
jgi:hypothetical protein